MKSLIKVILFKFLYDYFKNNHFENDYWNKMTQMSDLIRKK